jgi:signal transduction histidine kinase
VSGQSSSCPRPSAAAAVAGYTETVDVVFETNLDENLHTVDIDREQIGRVLTNLIDNTIAVVRGV